jgi:hypothetical protein
MDEDQGDDRVIPEYQAPRDNTARRDLERFRATLGALMTGVCAMGWVFIAISANVHHGPSPGAKLEWEFPVLSGAIILVVLGATGGIIWWRDRSTAFFAGALIGLAVAALIEGICYWKMA